MSNQINDNNSYLIYGIRDKTFEYIGIEKDCNRKNQQEVIDLLRNVKFAGDNRPSIAVNTLIVQGHEIDVITIFRSNNIPFYLKDDYKCDNRIVRKGCIYTRVGDTNTPIDSTADYNLVEEMWKKRFGLSDDIEKKLLIILDDYEDWVIDWGNKRYSFNKKRPEFKMTIDGEFVDGWEPLAAFYLAPTFRVAKLNLYYDNTIIYETEMWALDDYRKYLPRAEISHIYSGDKTIYFFYYLLDSIEGKILRINTNGSFDLASRELKNNCVLIFNNKIELEEFRSFFENKISSMNIEEIEGHYKYQLINDNAQNGGGRVFSSLHIAIAITAYHLWKGN